MRRRIRFVAVAACVAAAAVVFTHTGEHGRLAALVGLGVLLVVEDRIEHGRLPRRWAKRS
jgi:hypothetical protein